MIHFIVAVIVVFVTNVVIFAGLAFLAYRFDLITVRSPCADILEEREAAWEAECKRRVQKAHAWHRGKHAQIRQELVRLGVLPESPGWIEHYDDREGTLVKDTLSLIGELAFIERLHVDDKNAQSNENTQ